MLTRCEMRQLSGTCGLAPSRSDDTLLDDATSNVGVNLDNSRLRHRFTRLDRLESRNCAQTIKDALKPHAGVVGRCTSKTFGETRVDRIL